MNVRARGWFLGAWLAMACAGVPLWAEPNEAESGAEKPKLDVQFVPTPQAVVDKMLSMAGIKEGDVLYDLGCGDGRIVVTAARRYGIRAAGFDLDPRRVAESLANVRSNSVEHLVTIKRADVFTVDLAPASVVTLYLLPSLNVKLMPQLEKLKPGSRILSHDFDMEGAKPVQLERVTVEGEEEYQGYEDNQHTIYKWIVPWEKERGAKEAEASDSSQ
jgi:predicted RNA methylase